MNSKAMSKRKRIPKPLTPRPEVTQRLRVRFAKQGDLRLVSHRDMVRVFERMFRRVGVSLALSEGFHPRPRMTFPDALSLGVAATDEVMDVVLAERVDPDNFKTRLNETCPDGLVITGVRALGDGERKVKMKLVEYEIELPESLDLALIQQGMDDFANKTTVTVDRREKQIEIDLGKTLEGLRLDGRRLIMCIRVVQQSQLQPRDILAEIGLADVLRDGHVLTRTRIELTP